MSGTIDTTAQGSGNTQYTPEDLLIQGASSSSVTQMGQLAETLAEQDSLTASEKAQLETLANVNMPLLPPADQQKVEAWLQIVAAYPTSTSSSTQDITDPGNTQLLLSGPPASNPFMQPGIMAILAPILAKLLPIMNQIVRQDSVLDQALIGLSQNMAQSAYNFAVAAGQAKVTQLNAQVAQDFTLAFTSALQGAMSFGLGASYQKADSAIDEAKPNVNDSLYPGGNNDSQYLQDSQDWASNKNGWTASDPFPKPDDPKYPGGENDPEYLSDYQKWQSDASQQHQQLYQTQQTRSQTLQAAFSSISSIVQGAATAAQTGATLQEATDNAMSTYLGSMSQIIQQSMQKAVDDEKAANDSLKGLFQLYDQFASAITKAFYRG